MKTLLHLLIFSSFILNVQAQTTVKFEVRNFAINNKEVFPEKPIVIESSFKKISEVYLLGATENQEVGVRFSVVKEGSGKNKYWVYHTQFMHKNRGRWINMCNTPRHKMNGPYHLKNYFECKYDVEGNTFAIGYEVNAERK
jgi:hypothetical protein